MKCDVQAVTTFTLNLDLAAFSAIERALSFYRDRAILQDGDPASDLSRQFTSLLMKMRNSQKPKLLLEEAPDLPGPGPGCQRPFGGSNASCTLSGRS